MLSRLLVEENKNTFYATNDKFIKEDRRMSRIYPKSPSKI